MEGTQNEPAQTSVKQAKLLDTASRDRDPPGFFPPPSGTFACCTCEHDKKNSCTNPSLPLPTLRVKILSSEDRRVVANSCLLVALVRGERCGSSEETCSRHTPPSSTPLQYSQRRSWSPNPRADSLRVHRKPQGYGTSESPSFCTSEEAQQGLQSVKNMRVDQSVDEETMQWEQVLRNILPTEHRHRSAGAEEVASQRRPSSAVITTASGWRNSGTFAAVQEPLGNCFSPRGSTSRDFLSTFVIQLHTRRVLFCGLSLSLSLSRLIPTLLLFPHNVCS